MSEIDPLKSDRARMADCTIKKAIPPHKTNQHVAAARVPILSEANDTRAVERVTCVEAGSAAESGSPTGQSNTASNA